MSVNQMAQGAAAAVGLADAINAVRGADQPKIDCIDVGGGLPVSWGRDVPQSPTFQEYSSALHEAAPALFDGESFPRVITEFGAILNCKMAFFASIVGECEGGYCVVAPRTVGATDRWFPKESTQRKPKVANPHSHAPEFQR